MMQHLYRLFAYDDWANRETLASLKMIGTTPSRSLKLMGHIIAAGAVWLGRLRQDKKSVVVWPDLTLDQCESDMADLRRLWQDYLNKLTPAKLSQPIAYTNTRGESWVNTVEDTLMHVVIHSAYHRGQIATDLRSSGHDPAYTDFIHCIRQGFVK